MLNICMIPKIQQTEYIKLKTYTTDLKTSTGPSKPNSTRQGKRTVGIFMV